jgi:DNA repair photolyase
MACYREVDVRTITRNAGVVDAWFLARWGVNLYRGCEHGCLYCDGRAEKYGVQGSFDTDIVVKRNAVAVFEQEARRFREPGFLFLGGGVCDAWQQAEERYQLARGLLQVALDRGLSVHALTKSALLERDFDLLGAINQRTRAIVSCSINTCDEQVRQRFEPGASPLEARWQLLSKAKRLGLGVGVMAVPVLPGVSDHPESIDALARKASEVGVDFLSFGGLTLRPGVQKQTFLAGVKEHYPDRVAGYEQLYRSERNSGAAEPRYYGRLEGRFQAALRKYGLPGRIPSRLFRGLLPLYSEVAVLLEHREFEVRGLGVLRSDLANTGAAIQQWAKARLARNARVRGFGAAEVEREFQSRIEDDSLLQVPGVSASAWPVVKEISAICARSAAGLEGATAAAGAQRHSESEAPEP